MILNLSSMNQQAIESTTSGKKMKLSENATSMVFQLFTKNVYSDPIGSVVREITSNCFDSHIEAGVNLPVVIRRSKDPVTNNEFISFIDFGVGISPYRMENIYSVYFESTKRVDNEQIGGFGIGAKLPLAYKRANGVGEAEYDNSFNIITTFNGIKYIYLIYEGTESPVVSLLHEEETQEGNGTEVRVPVLTKDIQRFEQAMIKQLYYFENIVFEGFDKITLNNDYQIYQGENFLYRGNDLGSSMHICLGRVAYPIDYGVLGLNSSDYNVPVALRLNVGDINVTVSRESLDYNEQTIKLLKKKLAEVKQTLIDMLVHMYDECQTLEQYFNFKTAYGKLVLYKDLEGNPVEIYMGNMVKAKDIVLTNFKFSDLPTLEDSALFKIFFDVRVFGKKEKVQKYSWRSDPNSGDHTFLNRNYLGIKKCSNVYTNVGEPELKRLKQSYLKSQHSRYYIITKKSLFAAPVDDDNDEEIQKFNSLNSKFTDETSATGLSALGQQYVDAQEEYFQIINCYAKDYASIVVPDEYIESCKREKLSEEVKNTTIPVRIIKKEDYNNPRVRIKLDDLFKYKSIIYYGSTDEHSLINSYVRHYNLLFNKCHSEYKEYSNPAFRGSIGKKRQGKSGGTTSGMKGILFIEIAKGNVQYMKYCRNAHHISEYKYKMIHRKSNSIMEYFQTYDLVNAYENIPDLYKTTLFENLSPKYSAVVKSIRNYCNKIKSNSFNSTLESNKYLLSKYYNLDSIVLTAQQQKVKNDIELMELFHEINEPVLKYIQFGYNTDKDNQVLIDILTKVMDLK